MKNFISSNKLTLYVVLRLLVIASAILQAYHQNWNNVFLCIFTLVLFTIPSIIDKRLNISLPNTLESIILLFIFAAEILGEVRNFYGTFPYWDSLLHTINGFLCAAIGFSLIDILNKTERFHITLSPIFVALVAFCFSMTIGVLWEFFEFGMDTFMKTDMQKDAILSDISTVKLNKENENFPVKINDIDHTILCGVKDGETYEITIPGGYLDIGLIDTMKDLLVNFIGASVFSIIGLLYISDRDKYKFAENFMPTLKESKNDKDIPN